MTLFFVAFLVTTLTVAALLPILRRFRLWDVPNSRSSHLSPVPRGGGIAIILGVAAAELAGSVAGQSVPWPLLGGALVLAVVGLIDDFRTLTSRPRLLAQLSVGALIGAWAVAQHDDLAGMALVHGAVLVLFMAGYVNAFNFMDGINGISALNACLSGLWFYWLGHHFSQGSLGAMGLAVAGAGLAFLPWNAPKARVFLGDVGSYSLGALVAGMGVVAWARGIPAVLCLAPMVIYIADTAWALLKRSIRRAPITQAHREHAYQRLVDAGWSHLSTSIWTALAGASVMVSAWLLHVNRPVAAVACMAGVVVIYLVVPGLAVNDDETQKRDA